MIHALYSDLPKFKNLTFRPGLNVLLAESSPGASDRLTRNRAGKSSVTELIHFLLGSSAGKGHLCAAPPLNQARFGLTVDVAGAPISVERLGTNPSAVEFTRGDLSRLPIPPAVNAKTGIASLRNTLWREALGRAWFEISDSTGKYGPTFRSLFSYFVRRQSSKGFLEPARQSEKQQLVDQQTAISYLLGLDWTIPQQWQFVRDRENSLDVLRSAAKNGALGDMIPPSSELRTRLTITEAKAAALRKGIDTYHVLPEYDRLEGEASNITKRIAALIDESAADRMLVADIHSAIEEEQPASDEKLLSVYEEAGVLLPGLVKKRIDELRAFHQSVVLNRRSYLESELGSANRRIANRSNEIRGLESRRAELMAILSSHGALDHFNKLQGEWTRVQQEVERLKQLHQSAEAIETGRTELALERQQLLVRLRQDFVEESAALQDAIINFEEISSALYERAGSLEIGAGLNGPDFKVRIHGERSRGISNMQIFCFDLMLMRILAKRGQGTGFLMHDSHIFDGVDSRQIAKALQLGAEFADKDGFQYIVTMNSDDLPTQYPSGFSIDRHLLDVRLVDDGEDGGLFGFRFD